MPEGKGDLGLAPGGCSGELCLAAVQVFKSARRNSPLQQAGGAPIDSFASRVLQAVQGVFKFSRGLWRSWERA
ncbi:MAG: hypothetical protein DMG21_17835 [Acidobacteria bacterium]|nr:MAG: hypothetical protein DMG21_17835 [Acidobacteriota bacterium]